MTVAAPAPPALRLNVGVTGHRESNASFAVNRAQIETVLADIFDAIEAVTSADPGPAAPTRLHSLLSDGADQMAAAAGQVRGWELVAPLPFGRALNVAINAQPENACDAQALLSGDSASEACQARADAISHFYASAHLFELAERDAVIAPLYLAKLNAPLDVAAAQAFSARASERVALAGRVMIEQSDIVIGIWDGASHAFVGGSGHTIAAALELGAPVIWISACEPDNWTILRAPESLDAPITLSAEARMDALEQLVREALRPASGGYRTGVAALENEAWPTRSSRWWTGYRRIEAVFGDEGRPFRPLRQSYQTPDAVGTGSGASVLAATRALPCGDPDFPERVEREVLRRYAWSDGVSAHLSDSYRGGMIANFLLSAGAVVAGIAYQPFGSSETKWIFALIEFLMLAAILGITWLGGKRRWHGRWFETRRVAEYFRHAPIMLSLGVMRPPGRWPKGADTSWPEYYARHGLRAVGLPRVAITAAYLRAALSSLLDDHVVQQRDYHQGKAKRLTMVHRRLDALSTRLFQIAVVSVSIYLALNAAAAQHLVTHDWLNHASKYFTFLGVVLPTCGAAIAGMRYFGDFERFAAISEVTAEKLDALHDRLELLLTVPDADADYARAAELAHAADDIVVSEIENWQAVFGGKHITVPV